MTSRGKKNHYNVKLLEATEYQLISKTIESFSKTDSMISLENLKQKNIL